MRLPIPPLEATRQAFAEHASVYEGYDAALTERFFTTAAPELDALVREYDEAVRTSYLARRWRLSYLATRAPLAMASNFCMQLPLRYELGEFLRAFAALVAAYERGALDLRTPRGGRYSPEQFDVLQGGCRAPGAPYDAYLLHAAPKLGASGEAGGITDAFASILCRGQLYRFDLFTADGAAAELDESSLSAPELPASYAALSKLPSDEAAAHYAAAQANNAFFDIIERSRLNILVADVPFDGDSADSAASASAEREWAHYHAECYHYKTLNFIYNRATGNWFINAEHSFLDGGTIAYILGFVADFVLAERAGRAPASSAPAAADAAKSAAETDAADKSAKSAKSPARLIRQFVRDDFADALRAAQAAYRAAASRNDSFSARAPAAATEGFSKDFIAQAAIAYAARAVYARAVCQYEAVDMREFERGRTECVRAISAPLLRAFASFSRADFAAANALHKERIKRCKKGAGIDRHLYAMGEFVGCLAPAARAVAEEFYASASYANATSTVVSTSSIGKNSAVSTFNFHPVCPGGLGVSYASSPAGSVHDGSADGFVGDEFFFDFNYFDEVDGAADAANAGAKFKSGLAEFFAKFTAMK